MPLWKYLRMSFMIYVIHDHHAIFFDTTYHQQIIQGFQSPRKISMN
jgi:hypothetical protein